jgi:hypothetical protein
VCVLEDPTHAFTFGGWQLPYFDQEFGDEFDRVFNEPFDLLLGRKTYEIFAASKHGLVSIQGVKRSWDCFDVLRAMPVRSGLGQVSAIGC